MEGKKNSKIAAVIEIGSSLIRMRITQMKGGNISDIEMLEYPVKIGHEIFSEGKISFDTIIETTTILGNYKKLMSEYGDVEYRIMATWLLNQADNVTYLLDQIKIQNNMTVEILEYDREKTIINYEVLKLIESAQGLKGLKVLTAIIGTGNIGLTLCEGGRVKLAKDIPIGSIKLEDLLGDMRDKVDKYYAVVDEYLSVEVGRIINDERFKDIDVMLMIGSQSGQIWRIGESIFKKDKEMNEGKQLIEICKMVRSLPIERIAERYNLTDEQAKIIYSALMIYNHLMNSVKAKKVKLVAFDIWDVIIRKILTPKDKKVFYEHIRENAVSSAKVVAEQYNCSKEHYSIVAKCSELIFDKVKKAHGFSWRDLLLLELSAMLHECGNYVSSDKILQSTFGIINNTDIYGLSREEISLAATIAMYTGLDLIDVKDERYTKLSKKNQLKASKLSAILKLADALDKSHRQKLSRLKVRLQDRDLIITASGISDAKLERWAFEKSAPFFEEVFGIKPVFKFKSLLV